MSSAQPMSELKRAAVERLRRGGAARTNAVPREDESGGRLAPAQETIWLESQLRPGIPLHNLAVAFRIRGPLRCDVLERALEAVVARHDALRSAVVVSDGVPELRTSPAATVTLERAALADEPLGAALERLAAAPFDLTRPPLCRFVLVDEGDARVLLAVVHHIAADGWSLGVFTDELSALYRALADGTPPPPPPPRYAAYARASRAVAETRLRRAAACFADTFRAPLPPLPLPADRHGEPARDTVRATLSPRLRENVAQVAATRRISPFAVLLAAFQSTLARFGDADDVLVGVPVAGRRGAEQERPIGCFVNTVAVRARFDDDPAFDALVRRVARDAGTALAHGDVPLSAVLRALPSRPDTGSAPLLDVLFVMQNAPLPRLRLGSAEIERVAVDVASPAAALSLEVEEDGEAYRVSCRFDGALFERATVEAFVDAYAVLLDGGCRRPATSVSRLPLLAPAERRRIVGLDDHRMRPLGWAFVDAAVAETARERGRAVAVECGGRRLTYAQLEAAVAAAARALRQQFGGAARVAVLVERSVELPVALLAVLRAGYAYVPLDPRHPPAHLRAVLATVGADALVGSAALADLARSVAPDLPRAVLAPLGTAAGGGAALGPVERGPDDAAYVIATSGSTGTPKGVEIPHAALANVVAAMARRPGFGAADTLVAVTTVSFDIAALELFLPLVCGGRCVVADEACAGDPWALAALLRDTAATHLQATPSLFRALLDSGWEGAPGLQAWCGGEALQPALAAALRERVGALVNVYGPTETTIWSTAGAVGGERITAGEPLDNTRVYVLDRHGEPVPPGVRGELAIGGAGVARGYVGLPDQTRERFVADRFAGGGARMFRTGDLGLRGRDGRVVVFGRRDGQVKVRGFRVDLGDVEAALAALPQVRAAAAAVTAGAGGETLLTAYVVLRERCEPAVLSRTLRERVPEYMVPSRFVPCDALPLTANGKLDRTQLAAAAPPAGSDHGELPPVDGRQRQLAAIVEDVLGRRGVRADDDFYDLGGSSIDAVRVLARVRAAFGADVSLAAFLRGARSVRRLLAEIDARPAGEADALRALLDAVEAMSEDEAAAALEPAAAEEARR